MYKTIAEKFDHLGVDNAPGQESQQKEVALDLRGEKLEGPAMDFSHGDVDAHTPTPGSFEVFAEGVKEGGAQAYTPYKGRPAILEMVASRISSFAGVSIVPKSELILTAGTQGALFLAMGSNIMPGDKVAFVEPDYFANRKMVEFFNGEMVPIHMAYEEAKGCSGIDLEELEKAFQDGAKLFIFSNPNNPVGCIYSPEETRRIAAMAKRYGATLIVDELYSRQVYPGLPYTHLCAQEDLQRLQPGCPEDLVQRAGRLAGGQSHPASADPRRHSEGHRDRSGGHRPAYGRRQLSVRNHPGTGSFPARLYPHRKRIGWRHRDPGHRIRTPVPAQLPHQFLPGSR